MNPNCLTRPRRRPRLRTRFRGGDFDPDSLFLGFASFDHTVSDVQLRYCLTGAILSPPKLVVTQKKSERKLRQQVVAASAGDLPRDELADWRRL
jgi:hypothetical protein